MRTFSDEEREQIREQLIQTGRDLLLTYGPTKTTVKDITEPVGIAKPTFYQFFDAKADLYLVILERESRAFLDNVRTALADVEDPQEGLERLFWCYVEFGEENPFIQQVVIEGNYQDIIGDGSWGKLEEIQREMWSELIPLIEDLQEQCDGPLAEMDLLTITGLMSAALGWLMVHKAEYEQYEAELEMIDEGYYEHIQETMISVLANGLTSPA
ncbi:TetR/AcrR family transcriptional regulator [Natrialba taiwanensis]|uniref:Transcriptional regulator n=1 Tax=Natrialba taiwanensis DSM 12281 TaxID=1230458 RepID=M0A0V7_9EURY|nr:helix-turn-helix domain-containing protein [Natrialba taiwanensis]ELY92254.1 transcriptional regulator [Natrialba taiwanensis DSM 12281]